MVRTALTSALRASVARPLAARSLMTSSRSSMSSRSEMNHDPEVAEKEKHKNLKGQQDNVPHPETAPGWNESLASESEAFIKAEQSTDGPPSAELQKKTAEHLKKVHKD